MKNFILKLILSIICLRCLAMGREMSSLRQLVHQRLQKANKQLAEVKNPLVKALNYNLAQKSILGLHPETIGLLGDMPEKLLSSSQNLIDYEKKLHNREFHPESITSLNFRNKPDTHILKHQNFQALTMPTPFPPYLPITSTKSSYLNPFAFTSTASNSLINPTTQNSVYYQNSAPQTQFFARQPPIYDKISIQSNPRAEKIESNDQNRGFQNQFSGFNYQEPISYLSQLQNPINPYMTNVDQSYGNILSRNTYPFFDNQGYFDSFNQANPQSQLLFNQRSQLEKFQSRKRNPNHQLFSLREKEKDNLKQSFSDLALSGQRFMKAKEFKFEKSTDTDSAEEDSVSTILESPLSKPTRKIKKIKTTTSPEPEEYEAFLVEVTLKPEETTEKADLNENPTTRRRKFKTKSPVIDSSTTITTPKSSTTTTTTTTSTTTTSTTTTSTTTTSTTTTSTTTTSTTTTSTTTTSTTTNTTTTTTTSTPVKTTIVSTTITPSTLSSTPIEITNGILLSSTNPVTNRFIDIGDEPLQEELNQVNQIESLRLNELLKNNAEIDRLLEDPEFFDELMDHFRYIYEV